jgi:hypothetical protein
VSGKKHKRPAPTKAIGSADDPRLSAPGVRQRPDKVKWSRLETIQQTEVVRELVLQFASTTQMTAALRERWPLVGKGRAEKLKRRILDEWVQREDPERDRNRQRTIHAVQRAITQIEARMRGRRALDKDGKLVMLDNSTNEWLQLSKLRRDYVELLTTLEGTKAPEQVDVNINANVQVSASLVSVIAEMNDPEQMQQFMEMAEKLDEMEGQVVEMPKLPPHRDGARH